MRYESFTFLTWKPDYELVHELNNWAMQGYQYVMSYQHGETLTFVMGKPLTASD